VPPPGSAPRGKRTAGGGGALEVGPAERGVRLVTNDVTLDQTSGNWHHFNNLIHRIQNILTSIVRCMAFMGLHFTVHSY
jgi:hypothetical protein